MHEEGVGLGRVMRFEGPGGGAEGQSGWEGGYGLGCIGPNSGVWPLGGEGDQVAFWE